MRPFVDFATYNKSNPFGAVDPKFYPATHHHIGSDFSVPVGTPIVAPCDGQMAKAVFNPARGNTGIFIFHHGNNDWGLELCHLRELPALGNFKAGDVIAHSGFTGTAASGPHLHVTLHRDAMVTKDYTLLTSEAAYFEMVKQGQIVDPFQWFSDHRG